MSRDYRPIATIVRPHGKRGELLCRPWTARSPRLTAGLSVAILPPTLTLNRYQVVTSVRGEGAEQFVRFSEVGDLNDAEQVVGCRILAKAGELAFADDAPELESWVGFEAVDEALGSLGFVSAVEEGPFQPLLVIDHAGRELLVPAVEPIIRSVEGNVITLACPSGLVEQ